MFEKIKKFYPSFCILSFISSFLFLFRNRQFMSDQEFLFMILPQAVVTKHFNFFGTFWNSYSGCGVPFFPQVWSKSYFILNMFFRFFDPRTAYIFFLSFGFIITFFTFYYLANYFYRSRYISTILSLLYVSSGLFYGSFTTNYLHIEYFIIMPLIVITLHKYIAKKSNLYLILLGFLSVYAYLVANIVTIAMSLLLINLFIIFFAYDKYKRISAIIYHLFLINAVVISVNLFRIIPLLQYYFIEGIRAPNLYFQPSLTQWIGPLHFLFLSGHFPINLHYLSFFLLLAFLFYPTKPIEKIFLKIFVCYILITYAVYIVLLLSNFNTAKSLTLHKFMGFAHLPGTLMLGAGVRSFVVGHNRKKELEALIIFGISWIALYLLYIIKKQSFDIAIMHNIQWPFYFGASFFLIIFISKNTQFRKLCAGIIVLIFAMTYVHSAESFWETGNAYQETYLSRYNKEILDALEVQSPGDFIHKKNEDLYRIMSYKDTNLELVNIQREEFPFFAISNYPILFGISTIHQHDNVFLKRYLSFTEILRSADNMLLSPLLPFLNVKYLFSYNYIDIKEFSLIRELTDRKTKIYRNNNLLPRLFLVDKSISYNSKGEFIKIISDRNVDLTKTVLIEGYVPDESNNFNVLDYAIKDLLYRNDSIKIDLLVNKESFLVLLDNYFPGWKVYINKKRARIYPAYLTFRAIHLPDAGEYEIEFKYLPTFFVWGISISIFVFMLLSLGLLLQRRKRIT